MDGLLRSAKAELPVDSLRKAESHARNRKDRETTFA